jgi:uncharacterized protein YqeY
LTIHDELVAELQDGMRAKDRPRINVVRQIESEVSVARSAPGFEGEVDDALYLTVIGRYVKKMEKARTEYEALGVQGAAHAEKLAYEVEYLSRWLPSSLGVEDTKFLVDAAIVDLGADDPRMIGAVIGNVMRENKSVDGGTVARLVKEALASVEY